MSDRGSHLKHFSIYSFHISIKSEFMTQLQIDRMCKLEQMQTGLTVLGQHSFPKLSFQINPAKRFYPSTVL